MINVRASRQALERVRNALSGLGPFRGLAGSSIEGVEFEGLRTALVNLTSDAVESGSLIWATCVKAKVRGVVFSTADRPDEDQFVFARPIVLGKTSIPSLDLLGSATLIQRGPGGIIRTSVSLQAIDGGRLLFCETSPETGSDVDVGDSAARLFCDQLFDAMVPLIYDLKTGSNGLVSLYHSIHEKRSESGSARNRSEKIATALEWIAEARRILSRLEDEEGLQYLDDLEGRFQCHRTMADYPAITEGDVRRIEQWLDEEVTRGDNWLLALNTAKKGLPPKICAVPEFVSALILIARRAGFAAIDEEGRIELLYRRIAGSSRVGEDNSEIAAGWFGNVALLAPDEEVLEILLRLEAHFLNGSLQGGCLPLLKERPLGAVTRRPRQRHERDGGPEPGRDPKKSAEPSLSEEHDPADLLFSVRRGWGRRGTVVIRFSDMSSALVLAAVSSLRQEEALSFVYDRVVGSRKRPAGNKAGLIRLWLAKFWLAADSRTRAELERLCRNLGIDLDEVSLSLRFNVPRREKSEKFVIEGVGAFREYFPGGRSRKRTVKELEDKMRQTTRSPDYPSANPWKRLRLLCALLPEEITPAGLRILVDMAKQSLPKTTRESFSSLFSDFMMGRLQAL